MYAHCSCILDLSADGFILNMNFVYCLHLSIPILSAMSIHYLFQWIFPTFCHSFLPFFIRFVVYCGFFSSILVRSKITEWKPVLCTRITWPSQTFYFSLAWYLCSQWFIYRKVVQETHSFRTERIRHIDGVRENGGRKCESTARRRTELAMICSTCEEKNILFNENRLCISS